MTNLFKKFSNGLTDAQLERLAILSEEMGEAQQVIGKILRHGYDSWHPKDPLGPNNRELLEKELSHVRYMTDWLLGRKDIDWDRFFDQVQKKHNNIGLYLHHQEKA